ncbi:hypothetical protein [Streptomyces albireticuli]|uniref:hypothetical protein n=1 Tax=Streptomyces albireticuli TaxID=1940 RepID=UPI0036779A62
MIRTIVRRSSFRRRALVLGAALIAIIVPTTSAAAASQSDLDVVRIDPDAATPGGDTTVRAQTLNTGPERTDSEFIVEVTLPEGVRVDEDEDLYPDTCTRIPEGRLVRCTFPPGMDVRAQATAVVPVVIDVTVPAPDTLTGWVEVFSDDDPNTENNREPFEIQIVEA